MPKQNTVEEEITQFKGLTFNSHEDAINWIRAALTRQYEDGYEDGLNLRKDYKEI